MRRRSTMLAALLGTMLMLAPLQSQAFFGFFGGGFSFGTGWSGWGGPGWWGGPGYWGRGYGWHRPWYRHYYRPWHWRRHLWARDWGYRPYAMPLPYTPLPGLALPAPTTPSEPKEK